MLSDHRPSQFPNTYYDVVALAASAGGLHAFLEVVRALPTNFPAAVIIIQHLAPHRESLLPEIIQRYTILPVRQAKEGEIIEPGVVYTALPDYHMIVDEDGRLRLNQEAPINFSRPAIDPLIQSMAEMYQDRLIAVILSGMGSDGSKGILSVKAMGGIVIVQNLETSQFTGMPCAAIRTGATDYVLPLDSISSAIVSLVTTGAC